MSIDCPVDVRRIRDNECCYQDYSHGGAFVILYPSHSRQTLLATISYHDTATRLPLSVCIGGKGPIQKLRGERQLASGSSRRKSSQARTRRYNYLFRITGVATRAEAATSHT